MTTLINEDKTPEAVQNVICGMAFALNGIYVINHLTESY